MFPTLYDVMRIQRLRILLEVERNFSHLWLSLWTLSGITPTRFRLLYKSPQGNHSSSLYKSSSSPKISNSQIFEATKGPIQDGDQGLGDEMAKDKGKGEETKPSSKIKDAAKAHDGAVKTKEAEAKDVPAFQPSKKEDPPSPAKAQSKCRSHQIFGVTKFGFQPISCVHKCKKNPRLIE